MGGLSRRAHVIKEIQDQADSPVILLDGGSLFFPEPAIPDSLLTSKKVQARGIARAMTKMGYDAIGIAPRDLAGGFGFLTGLDQEFTLPLISANLVGPGANTPSFTPFIIKKAGDISIGIIGLTGAAENRISTPGPEGYQILEWRNILEDTLAMVRQKADMVILLSSYPEGINQQIAEGFDGIHLIIQSGHSTANKAPRLFNNTLITQIGSRGKYMGKMEISWNNSHRWQQNFPPHLKQARDRLDRINWRLGRLEKRHQGATLDVDPAYTALLEEKDRAIAEIKQLEGKIEQEPQDPSSFASSFLPLSISLPVDPEIREIVLQTKIDVNAVGKQKMARAAQSTGKMENHIGSDMVGWKKCQGCHQAQTTFWLNTGHARAWQTLADVQQEFNQDCIICHVTLPTYDPKIVHAENLLASLNDVFKGVGCETCHGPGRQHTEDPARNKPLQAGMETCLLCHTPDHDTSFDFERKVKLIRCPPDKQYRVG